MQMDPSQLAALSAVLRLGAFEAAAHALSVTPSAISQRIKALEDRTGTALVLRGSPCTGTAAGLRIAKHAEDIGLLEAQLARELSLEADQGPVRLRIAVNADSLASWFIGAMAAVEGVLFDLLVDDQDHSAEWLKRGEVSAAVTASSKPVTGFEAYPLGTLDYAATASPAFMARWFAQGVTPEAAAKAPCMIFNAKDNLQRLWLERNVAPGLSPPAHFLPSTQAFIDAAAAGLGWGMNPLPMVAEDIRSGRLVPLIAGSTLPVPLTWQVARVMAPALAEVTRAVQKSARQYLTQN
ncbi:MULTISPECIES: LysR family transcriptional regulator ArgP [Leisingera]|jgi:LysR family transcriptional regulator (chromosome initiation inhibitor)|uniref:LysR family transcriptional regulator ArgP n=1 Tax=Leisingera TaxID=191028 RepID=UPI0011546421|nr:MULTISPECIES: LysR family transcriptional regulator ArgP [Leisingera]QDI76326.1 LysR family transcriptional regulator ArgP [Leisingera aquaemixtae]